MVKEVIKKAAKIARIELEDGESEHLASELKRILEWIGELPEFETELEKKYIRPREDKPAQYADVEGIKSRFPRRRGDYCVI